MIVIVGVTEDGVEGLSEKAKRTLKEADVIFGGRRHINSVRSLIENKTVFVIGADIKMLLEKIEESLRRGKKIVVLNSGDPLLFGLARRIIERFGKEFTEVIPNVSSVQMAFSKIKESWEDAKIISLHSGPTSLENHINDIRENEKILFLTSGSKDPLKIARFFRENNIAVRDFFVLEELGGPNERIRRITPDNLRGMRISPLNVVIVLKDRERRKFEFGIPDHEFEHERTNITKAEVRSIVLSKLSLCEDSVVWDIGGGSGSVSVECALLARRGKIFCIEKDENAIRTIKRNLKKFAVTNVEVVRGKAPEVLSRLPDPHSVFVGGGGKNIEGILRECMRRKPKSIVCTFVDILNFTKALDLMNGNSYTEYKTDALFINLMRLKRIDGYRRFEQLTGIFLLHASSVDLT